MITLGQKLKLKVYSIDQIENERIMLGYIILDLRSAIVSSDVNDEKWFKLINLQEHSPFKPEIKLSFCISLEKSTVNFNETGYLDHETKTARSNFQSPNLIKELKYIAPSEKSPMPSPVVGWNNAAPSIVMKDFNIQLVNGYYQVGPAVPTCHMFTLSISISFIEGFDIIQRFNPTLATSNDYYYFFYTFLDKQIKSLKFQSRNSKIQFATEQSIFKINATKKDFALLLSAIKEIQIYFIHANDICGIVNVDLLFMVYGFQEVNVDKVYPMFLNNELEMDGNGTIAGVGISLCLAIDGSSTNTTIRSNLGIDIDKKLTEKDHSKIDLTKEHKYKLAENIEIKVNTTENKNLDDKPSVIDMNASPGHDTFMNMNNESHINFPAHSRGIANFNLYHNYYDNDDDIEWNQFRVSIEQRSIQNLAMEHFTDSNSIFVLFKYNYTPFRSNEITITKPTKVYRGTTKSLLEHSFYSFEFIMKTRDLLNNFTNLPLVIEMYWFEADEKGTGERMSLGDCKIDLSQLFLNEKRVTDESVIHSMNIKAKVQMKIPRDGIDKICDLETIIAIEDFGAIKDIPKKLKKHYPSQSVVSEDEPEDFYDHKAYEISLELELWKQQQKKEFMKTQAENEKLHLEKLSLEHEKLQAEQTAAFEKKMNQYNDLLTNLEKLGRDLSIRETKLRQSESEFDQQQADLTAKIQKYNILIQETLTTKQEIKQELETKYLEKESRFKTELSTLEKEKEAFRTQLLTFQLNLQSNQTDIEKNSIELRVAREKLTEYEEKCKTLVDSRHNLKKKYLKLNSMYKGLVGKLQAVQTHTLKVSNVEPEIDFVKDLKTQVENGKRKVLEAKEKTDVNAIEVKRLETEVEGLLKCGYKQTDLLIIEMQGKIQKLKNNPAE
jgi:hypothetical protein